MRTVNETHTAFDNALDQFPTSYYSLAVRSSAP
jgi:hypothetical protein